MIHPKISLIVATLNAEKNLEKTIISFINQSYKNKELIIIDGGSLDKTNKIILQYQKHIFYSCSRKDRGVYEAWNNGLVKSSGDWVCFLGAGDEFYNDTTLFDMIKLSANKDINFISGKIYLCDNKGNYIEDLGKKWNYKEIISQIVIGHPGALHKKKLFENYGFFKKHFKISGDHEFLIRVGKFINSNYLDDYVVKMDNCGISKSKPIKAIIESGIALKENRYSFFIIIKYIFFAIFKYYVKHFMLKSTLGKKILKFIQSEKKKIIY